MAQYIQVELCSLCSSGVGSSKVGAQRQGWHGGGRGGGGLIPSVQEKVGEHHQHPEPPYFVLYSRTEGRSS